ncbi:MAG: ABC transporter permease [Thermoleophilia bacterium]|nr:ABC transporter permease [Thermoleophilia bacterium]
MTAVTAVALHTLQEALRRRVFLVVLVLTVAFLGLFWLGVDRAFDEALRFADGSELLEIEVAVGATLLGLAMFATLFLGTVLAIFLTLGAVRGDAERGTLQPLVVRPIGRSTFLLARFLGAAAVCTLYVVGVFTAAAGIVRTAGGWWPDEFFAPTLELAAAVVLLCALSLLGSVFLSTTANGIAVFMLFGAGLTGGLLGQIGEAMNSETLIDVGRRTAYALPFEALYQDGLHRLTSETFGAAAFVVRLGPFGGAEAAGGGLFAWIVVYVGLVALAAGTAFARRDL